MNLRALLPEPLQSLLSAWSDQTRLYRIESSDPSRPLPGELMVESLVRVDELSQPFWMQVNCLSLNAHIELKAFFAQPLTLITRLADGSEHRISGYVVDAIAYGGDGALARFGLVIRPWIALPRHTLDSNGWEQKSVIELVEALFADHPTIAAWAWDDDVPEYVRNGLFARNGGQRSYSVQYQESDLDFVHRILAEEGIGYRVEENDSAPGKHRVVFFVNSRQQPQDPTSASSLGGQGIRFHRSSSQEVQDSIQAMGALRTLGSTATVVQGWDYKQNRAIVADVPTHHAWGGEQAASMQSWLTSYDPTGDYLFGNPAEAQFCATRLQEAREARFKTWLGRATVRTLRPGTWMAVTQSTLDPLAAFGATPSDREFLVTDTWSIGINNLPKDLNAIIAQALGETLLDILREAAENCVSVAPTSQHEGIDTQDLIRQAEHSGYACQFKAIRRDVPWRPVLMDGTGLRPRPRPMALGAQTAIVVGPHGETTASGADEVYTDNLGRVRVQFHWQNSAALSAKSGLKQGGNRSCWVRVMQRLSGPGMGHQFIPRIGQEVVVNFINNDIDRPIVMATLYSGRGEGGVPRTPGGQAAQIDTSAFAQSTDHSPSGQMNLVGSGSGGNSPAWHGAAPGAATDGAEGQNNAAALSGVKSKEFGGPGHNQLVFDDTPQQGRTQLHSTTSQTWLQMGHLLHQADNHRGSFRGQGLELRTDAWGGIRAARGVMLSSFGLNNGLGMTADPAGDNAAGMALAKQLQQMVSTFHQAATTHQTVGLAAAAGSTGAKQSSLDDQLAPAAALVKSLSGMVSSTSLPNALADAADKNTTTGQDKVPHMTDPNIALMGKAGVGITAGQDLHLSSQDTTTLASGQDTHLAVGGQARIHTGQAIGILAGAIQAGSDAAGKGLSVIAAQGDIDLQAQHGAAQLASKGTLEIKTASGVATVAAAKKVYLAVSGGASITMDGGQITLECPGKILVQAANRSFVGGGTMTLAMPKMPRSAITDRPVKFDLRLTDVPGPHGLDLPLTDWRIVSSSDASSALHAPTALLSGTSDANGKLQLTDNQAKQLHKSYNTRPNELWVVFDSHVRALSITPENEDWTNTQKLNQALDSMGYAHDHDSVGDAHVDDFHAKQARLDLNINAPSLIYDKLKGGR